MPWGTPKGQFSLSISIIELSNFKKKKIIDFALSRIDLLNVVVPGFDISTWFFLVWILYGGEVGAWGVT